MSARALPAHLVELAVVADEDYRDRFGDLCHRRTALARCRECKTDYRYHVDTDMQVLGWSHTESVRPLSAQEMAAAVATVAAGYCTWLRGAPDRRLSFHGYDGDLVPTRTGIAELHYGEVRASRDSGFEVALTWSTTSYGPQDVSEVVVLSQQQLTAGIGRMVVAGKARQLRTTRQSRAADAQGAGNVGGGPS